MPRLQCGEPDPRRPAWGSSNLWTMQAAAVRGTSGGIDDGQLRHACRQDGCAGYRGLLGTVVRAVPGDGADIHPGGGATGAAGAIREARYGSGAGNRRALRHTRDTDDDHVQGRAVGRPAVRRSQSPHAGLVDPVAHVEE
jgi:hypothetical protein